MKKLYEKNQMTFTLLIILIYVLGTSFAEGLTKSLGIEKLLPAIFQLGLAISLINFLWKNSLLKKYGLIKPGIF